MSGLAPSRTTNTKTEIGLGGVMNKIPGYCALCRAYEMEHYGKVLNRANPRHEAACKAAGCKHPPSYLLSKPQNTRSPAKKGANVRSGEGAETPKQAQQILRQVGDAFVNKFLEVHPAAIPMRSKEPAVCWGVTGVVNYAAVAEFSGPTIMADGSPLLFRIRVNLYSPPALYYHLKSPAARQKLGVPASPEIATEPSLELTAAPEEVEGFGAWVSSWFHAQSRHAARGPKPPTPLILWDQNEDLTERREELVSLGRDWRGLTYLWTARSLQLFVPWWRGKPS
jgi:hypothetical protein